MKTESTTGHATSRLGLTVLFLVLCLGVCSRFPAALNAQTASTGALTGIVSDASGAAVSGAHVRLTSQGTGEVRETSTSASGIYLISALLPGHYSLEIRKDGFKSVDFKDVQVVVTETASLNTRLEIGTVAERVTVEASFEQLQTESSTLGRVTSGEQVRSLPLVARNYTQIIGLNPGVNANVTNAGELGKGSGGTTGTGLVVNGGANYDNNYQMNGVGINDLQSSGTFSGGVAIPNPDTIQEFKVQTSQYDAAFGRNAGANVDIVTKGGSNEFHGALWEFFRNDALNANSFFRNETNQPRPVLKQNQFGFDLGGPIKQNKLFFFTSYQGTRQRNGVDLNCSSSVTTPPLTNDRSAAALGTLFAGQRGVFQNAFGGVGPAIAADGSNINPFALALLQAKLPNGQFIIPTPQTIQAGQGFSAYSVPCPFTENQFMTNADFQQSTNSRFSARFFFANSTTTYTLPQANLGGGTAPGFPVNLTNNFRNFSLTHMYVFSPTVVNTAEIGFHRTFAIFDQSKVFKYSQFGASVPLADDSIPVIALDFGSPTGLSLGGNGQTVQVAQNTFTAQDSVSWSHGRHTIRFGGGLAREQTNNVGFHFLAGEIFLSWPDFLLGLDGPSNGTGAISNIFASVDLLGQFDRAYRVWEANGYVQDDFKVTRRLTLNLGFRYDRLGDLSDAKGRNASFDASLANPNPPPGGTLAGIVVPSNFSGGAIPAGVTKADNALGIKGYGQNTWNPRLGFAWQLPRTDRVVLRGGYGVYHSRYTGQPFIQLLTAPPFSVLRFNVAVANAAANEQVPFPLNVPAFPAFVPYAPDTSNTIFAFDPGFRPPVTHQYSLGLQTELTHSLVLDVGYSGTRGLHLIRQRSINQAQLASPANPIRGETTNTVANIPLRVPFEGWSSSQMQYIESSGASWYNALLVGLTKRFSHGLQTQVSYTFAKSLATDYATTIGANGGQTVGDQNTPSQRYGPDLFIRSHRFIVNYTYQFPSPGRPTSFKGELLGGWSVAGVTTIQSGRHLTVSFTNGTNVLGTTNDRASLSGACPVGNYLNPGSITSNIGGAKTYINTSCFTAPAVVGDDRVATGFGNAGVGILTGPGQNNWDIALIKHFPLRWPKESAQLEFRTEFFNAFNHPQFDDPATTFGAPGFGQITNTIVAPRILQFALKLNF